MPDRAERADLRNLSRTVNPVYQYAPTQNKVSNKVSNKVPDFAAQMRADNAKYGVSSEPAPAAVDSSMTDVASKKGRKEAAGAAGLAKAQHKESEEEKKRWDAEVKKAVAEGKKYKKWVAIKVRELHANASVDELFELVDILSAAGEKYASLEASVFAYEKQGEEEEAKRTAEVDEAALVLGLTDFVKEGYKVGEGLRFSGDTKGNAILLASSLLEEMEAPVPEDPNFADVNYGGRRRRTKKSKKSRRATKRKSRV